VGHRDGTIALWDLETNRLRTTYRQTALPVAQLAFVNKGQHLLVGCGRGNLFLLLDVETGEKTAAEMGVLNGYAAVQGSRLALASCFTGSWGVHIYDSSDGEFRETAVLPELLFPISMSPDGKYLATNGNGGFEVWNLEQDKPERSLQMSGETVQLEFSPDSRTIAAVTLAARQTRWNRGESEVHSSIGIWDVATGFRALGGISADWPQRIAFSPDGLRLVGVGRGQTRVCIGAVSWSTEAPKTSLPCQVGDVPQPIAPRASSSERTGRQSPRQLWRRTSESSPVPAA
jgi:WD40 repeat protein